MSDSREPVSVFSVCSITIIRDIRTIEYSVHKCAAKVSLCALTQNDLPHQSPNPITETDDLRAYKDESQIDCVEQVH